MLKQSLYPKTTRLPMKPSFQVTEKLDGSNLCFFVSFGRLFIAQRNNVYTLEEALSPSFDRGLLYKGLYQFLVDRGETLKESIFEGSAICGEWMGMGKLKYPEYLANRFVMFAKARVVLDEANPDWISFNQFKYDVSTFAFAFNNQDMTSFIEVVPVVKHVDYVGLSIEAMDELYELYTNSVGRPVEGFVAHVGDTIFKYVRMKNGKIEPHFDRGE